ncbi:MAG: outer membrane beta-barrel protein [Deltaproteobacteria bacterium]|nr:outer membrane beta-barrel protein [Deltaproteobacteria bacterium]
MKLKAFIILGFISAMFLPTKAEAVGNYSVGVGAVGNIYVANSSPELNPGPGGYFYFDYRWSPQFSTQFSALITTHDGTGRSANDDGILFIGLPTFDLKFYLLSDASRWDPYGLIGMGVYAVSEGSKTDGTTAVGVGANLGLGLDYYVTEQLAVGFAGIYRSVGLIDSTGPGSNGTALFPFSLLANVSWHW